MNGDLARWAIESWMLALGLASDDQFKPSKPPIAPFPVATPPVITSPATTPSLGTHTHGKKSFLPKFASLLLVGLLVVVVFALTRKGEIEQPKAPQASSKPKEATQPVVTIMDSVQAYYLQNVNSGQMLIIEGEVLNESRKPVSFVMIEGKLFNNNDTVAQIERCYVGNTLTRKEIANLKLAEIQDRIMYREGKNMKNVRIPPAGKVPFMLVFHNLPEMSTLSNYSVNVISSKFENEDVDSSGTTNRKDPGFQGETPPHTASTNKSPIPANTLDRPASPSPSPVSVQEVRINYVSEATPYVIGMINYARDEAKLNSIKNKLDGLAKPQKGDKASARKLNDEALALMRQSKDSEAIPILEEAHRTDPSDVEITNNLASAYFNSSFANNDFSKAKAMLVDTLSLKPDRNIAWANLGRAFAMEGNELAATNCYINFYYFSKDRAKALQSLAKGTNEPNLVLNKAMTNAYQYGVTTPESDVKDKSGRKSAVPQPQSPGEAPARADSTVTSPPMAPLSSQSGKYPQGKQSTRTDASDSEVARKLYELANKENGTLQWNSCLATAALMRAKQLQTERYFDHEDPKTSQNPVWKSVTLCIPVDKKKSKVPAGENMARGIDLSVTPSDIHKALMESSTHRQNIIDRRFNHVGVACYDRICVELFAGF
ncbi:MAG: DUF3426 domain-containing protein [Syntrophobacteraceae bacterium]